MLDHVWNLDLYTWDMGGNEIEPVKEYCCPSEEFGW